MALEITSAPSEYPIPVPVSDCLQWCFQPDDEDVVTEAGTFAQIEVDFSAVPVIPANGTEFTLWGHLFTIDDSVPYTQDSFEVTALGSTTGSNFRRMLQAHFFFSSDTNVHAGGDLSIALIDWLTCGEQDNFTGISMDVVALEDTGATVTVTNGTTPVYVDGYMIQVRLFKYSNEGSPAAGMQPITLFKGINPMLNCDSVDAACIDFMRDAKRTLFTPMPDLSVSSEISPDLDTMVGLFKVQYGWTYRDENCTPKSGFYDFTEDVLVMDTVFAVEESLMMQRYIYDHPSLAAASPQFLTNQPTYNALGHNSFAWFWLSGCYGSLYPTVTRIRLRFNIFYLNGTTASVLVDYDPILEYQVHCFNVSPGRLLSLFSLVNLTTVSHYFVRAEAWDDTNLIDTVGWEIYMAIEQACENLTDVYFKTPPGGIGTLLCEIIEKETVQEGTEICLNIPCSTTRTEKAKYSGRMLTNIRAYEKITLRARRNFQEQEVAYFASLKASPERWVQIEETGIGGTWIAKRLLVDTGGIRIFQTAEYIELTITGSLADIPLQSPRKV